LVTIAAGPLGKVAAVEYVMVPVPEEFAGKVLTYVSWKDAQTKAEPPAAERSATEDHGAAAARVFARLDSSSRALIEVIAAAALERESLGLPEAAVRAGMGTRESVGILLELNTVLASEGAPTIAISGGDADVTAGGFTWDAYTVAIAEAIGAPLLELARVHPSG
jgi:hypothetical protein